MDDTRFDELAKRLGAGLRRREALRLLAGGALGAALGLLGGDALAQEEADEDAVEEAGKGKNRNNKLKARRRRKRNNRRNSPPPPVACTTLGNLCFSSSECCGGALCRSSCFTDPTVGIFCVGPVCGG